MSWRSRVVRDDVWVATVVGLTAYLARLLPVMGGAGLLGVHDYDASVYYAAAAGLAHGVLPYRDFLFLHPPGVIVSLLPFAVLGRAFGDDYGMSAGCLAWFGLGAANAVLVTRILRRLGAWPALFGGLFYAVFLPAVFIERSTLLEAPSATLTLAAVLLLLRSRPATRRPGWSSAAAGALVGLSAGIKIWGVVDVLALLGWVAWKHGRRRAGAYVLGAAGGVTAICLPFFLAAPRPMWRMVVLDQLGRPDTLLSYRVRLEEIAGLPPDTGTLALAGALALAALSCALATRNSVGRLGLTLLASDFVLLMCTPTWFEHYAGLTAASGAVVIGAACASAGSLLRRSAVRAAAATVVIAALTAVAVPTFSITFGRPFPPEVLAAAEVDRPGCVTTDDPTTLIETDLLDRNLRRGCPLVVDLGGYSYDLRPEWKGSRETDVVWQRLALAYLGSGSVTMVARFHDGLGFDATSAAVVEHWPALARSGRFAVRQPEPGRSSG